MAENCISKAVSIAGNITPIIKLEAARLLHRRGNYAGAIEYLNDVVKVFPKSALAWYELGCCQAEVGFREAKSTLEQCLRCRPGWNVAEEALRQQKRKGFFSRLFGR